MLNNKRKVIVNIKRLQPYLSENLKNSENSENYVFSPKTQPNLNEENSVPSPDLPNFDLSAHEENANKSVFPLLPPLPPPPVKRK